MQNIKKIKQKINTFSKKPEEILVKMLYLLSPIFTDKMYLKMLFPLKVGYKLDLKNPKTFNAKLQWLKLFYRNPEIPTLVDKYEFKTYISNIFGKQYVVENYGVWDSFEEIDFNNLPDKFVLKTTHDQGGVVICNDKSTFNLVEARKKLNKHLKRKFFYLFREWPYKYVKPRIIAEKILITEKFEELVDYKFYCFNGEVKILFIAEGRQREESIFDFYDLNFNRLDIEREGHRRSRVGHVKPDNFEIMVKLAAKISSDFPHVRVDFYNINGSVYFGECTFFTGGGFKPFFPEKWDYILGNYLKLPNKQ